MDDQAILLLIVAAFAVLLLLLHANEIRVHHKRIRKFLTERGATEIEIYWIFDGDRSNKSYNVWYTDSVGQRHRTACKMGSALDLNDGTMYWADPPEV